MWVYVSQHPNWSFPFSLVTVNVKNMKQVAMNSFLEVSRKVGPFSEPEKKYRYFKTDP